MLTARMARQIFTSRLLLPAMLWPLHGALLLGVESPWVHPLLLAHLGLFLLWQPLWRGESRVGTGALAFIAITAGAALFWLSWWTVAFWLTGLFGLVGARIFVFQNRLARWLYLTVMIYLLAVLLLWVLPNLFIAQYTIDAGSIVMRYVLPLLLLAMTVLPVGSAKGEVTQAVDFIYSLLLFMLLALVVLGSLAFMTLGKLDYLDALLRTLFLMGLILLVFGALWNPRFGYAGLQVMFSRYLLNVGTPFEHWLTQLTEAVQREPDAEAYLRRAVTLLEEFQWLSGLSWQSPDGTGQFGLFSNHSVVVQESGLRLTVYSHQSLNPTLALHIYLLVKLIGYFYQAKQREKNLRDITRLQAVYETGSRLTHDLKNMLQSLLSLSAIAQSQEERAQQLLQQQLPMLTQRIEATLLKLHQPNIADGETAQLALNVWWDALRQRNQHQAIDWHEPDSLPDTNIPAALFDCIIDNLIDNVLRKRQSDPGVAISIKIQSKPVSLTVCDSGDPIPEKIAKNLLRGVVPSENGLGIGLYQAARWAGQLGYRMSLISNRDGNVCFELRYSEGEKERRNLNL
jgi:signal transduction histidine kinase